MALGFVQGTFANSTGAGTVLTKAFASNVTAGNLLFAVLQMPSNTGFTVTFTDNMAGNSWSASTNSTSASIWRSEVIATSSAAVTITATASSSVSFMELYIGEFNIGGHALSRDVNDVVGSDAGTTLTSAAITTTASPEVLICFYGNNGSLTGLTAGWTQNVYDSPNGNGYASSVQTTNNTYTLTATQPAGGDSNVSWSYKATTSGATPVNATLSATGKSVFSHGGRLLNNATVSI